MSVGSWTSLEVVKLLVSALIPFAVVYAGYRVSRAASRLEAVQWANQTVIQRRLEIFAEVAPKLNQLLCFALFIGGWKDIRPADVVRLKREVDEIMYVNRVLFSPALFDAYVAFTQTLFETYSRRGGDALLRVPMRNSASLVDRRKLEWWDDSMKRDFSTSNIPSADEVQAAYNALSGRFRRDLYVTREELSPPGS